MHTLTLTFMWAQNQFFHHLYLHNSKVVEWKEKKIIAPIHINFVYFFLHDKKEKCVTMVKEKREKAKRRFYGKTGKKYFLHRLQLFSHVTQLKEGKRRNLMFLGFLLFIKKKSLKSRKNLNKESNSFSVLLKTFK